MKWWPNSCEAGDMIRVKLGSIDHYGIFVSEEEVIQFGLPPIPANLCPEDEIEVLATDIDTFACGNIIEVAELDRKEKKLRLCPEKTIETARSMIGTKGYSMIHNNCEHFVNECVFGERRSSQVDSIRDKWNLSRKK